MSRSLVLFALIFILGLSACSPPPVGPAPTPTPFEGAYNPHAPQAGDEKLQRDLLAVTNVSIMTTNSLPVRLGVNFTYALPTVCHELRVAVSGPDASHRIDLQIYTLVDPSEVCIMIAMAPVSDTVLIGVLPEGTYSIYVNGDKVGNIALPAEGAFNNPDQTVVSQPPSNAATEPPMGQANLPPVTSQPYDPQPGDEKLLRGEVFIDSASIAALESYPPHFILNLSGSLPTPCHQLRAVVSAPDASQVIAVDVYSLTDPNAICAQVLQPFTVSISIPTPLAGKYSVVVNGIMLGEIQW
jgi:hypothetical protein